MNKSLAVTLVAILPVIFIVSCVSGKKFREVQNTSRQNMIDRDDFKTENLSLCNAKQGNRVEDLSTRKRDEQVKAGSDPC